MNDIVLSAMRKLEETFYSWLKDNDIKVDSTDILLNLRYLIANWYQIQSRHQFENDEYIIFCNLAKSINWYRIDSNNMANINSLIQYIIDFMKINNVNELEYFDFENYLEDNTNNSIIDFVDNLNSLIKEKDLVYLKADPNKKGMVFNVQKIGNEYKYDVFIDNQIKTYFDGQILPVVQKDKSLDLNSLLNILTAQQINNPTKSGLYSLNAAKIDFVPYQYRPAIKMINSDSQRILIADSVGVGKTIETGLIIKELAARQNLQKILIICPKPLITENKWENEMEKFDESFHSINGKDLRHIINKTQRDGRWSDKDNKIIIPYSILNKDMLEGKYNEKTKYQDGLYDIGDLVHFDLVIVDEAHHVRNNNTEGYKAVKFFCDRASAVVFLTATPLQTSDDDLYNLLNLLDPNQIIDYNLFEKMLQPNKYISRGISIVRAAKKNWPVDLKKELDKMQATEYGRYAIVKSPAFFKIMTLTKQEKISQEERIELINLLESIHTFSQLITRTRRKDIEDFCIRRSNTIEIPFTKNQKELHDSILEFEADVLTKLHGDMCIKFMMTTISRQAASCLYGLSPCLEDFVNKHFENLKEELDGLEFEEEEFNQIMDSVKISAKSLLKKAKSLDDYDPKYEAMRSVIDEKNKEPNNKVLIFSSFKHTLKYLSKRLSSDGYRIAIIDGSVEAEDRKKIKDYFKKRKENTEAIDILLFTEVGCEGLDYQFCNMMINYDLPWNPMRIEQRIGRIDRRGQESDVVNIYNMITSNTIDAEIYHRCLNRIGIFNSSVGECEVILGEITKELQNIYFKSDLTENEKNIKLQQMSDNKIREIQEIKRLEENDKDFFGLDVSGHMMNEEIKKNENVWTSPDLLQSLVNQYLLKKLNKKNVITGSGAKKNIRLSYGDKQILKRDYLGLPDSKQRSDEWLNYLIDRRNNKSISYDPKCAEDNKSTMLINVLHPLVLQAANYFKANTVQKVVLTTNSNLVEKGQYPFEIYSWRYIGKHDSSKLIVVSNNEALNKNLIPIIKYDAITSSCEIDISSVCDELDLKHYELWKQERNQYIEEVKADGIYKKENLKIAYESKKNRIQSFYENSIDPSIKKMRQGELNNIERGYLNKVNQINELMDKVDIHTEILIKGVIKVL